ncbi:MAG: cardiolipin synthase [Planctomycetota bacterium]|nr:MAG: cardiolipin synthase [Planctomycetota bacterium]GDY09538.1 cardiolipin synthase [Planctomycetia bacterium]
MTLVGWLLSILGYGLTLLLLPVVLLVKKRQPVSSVAWMLAIVFIPIGGAVLFLVFGINRVERRKASKQRSTEQLAEQRPVLSEPLRLPRDDDRPETRRLMRLTQRLTDEWPTEGNSIELLTDTNRTLGLIEQALLSASESIHLEYYIWQPDRTGTRIRDLLIRKAREGVRVRYLYDGIGSFWLTKRFLRPMHDAGIQIATFLPGQTFRERWSLNLRNHRKIAVIDGRIAFTGGMNIGDEYIGRSSAFGFWRDAHLRVVGPEVRRHQMVFAEDWFFATGEVLPDAESFPPSEAAGTVMAQTVSGGPEEETSVFQALMLAAINEAQDRVQLVTSYFAPPTAIITALENAAFRGVHVRLLLSGRLNHVWTLLAGRSVYDSLLKAGVEISEYQRGLLHSKTLTIDGHWSLVGSANVDCRSLFLNFESGVVLYDERLAEQLEQQFERDTQDSARINPEDWERRPWFRVVGENLCRLFTPVL